MLFAQSVLLVGLMAVNGLGLGLLFVRYLRWRPLETLCTSVALALFFQYLAAFSIYALNLLPEYAYLPSVLSACATIACWKDIHRLWRYRETRRAIVAYWALAGWLLLLMCLIRTYSGGTWYGDWYEHYDRANFFSEHKPLFTKFLDVYLLPARPPMMNLLAAQFFWQVGNEYEHFQVLCVGLSALVIFPCCLIARGCNPKARNIPWILAGLLALNPMFVQNGTFTWTKQFAAFYCLVAMGLYLSAWRRNDMGRMIGAVGCMSAAVLVHYSAAPFAIFLAGHYLFAIFRQHQRKWQEAATLATVSAAILSTWLAWSVFTYGPKTTFGSNTTVTYSKHFTLSENASRIAKNIVCTLIPFPLRGSLEAGGSQAYSKDLPPKGPAYWREWFFRIYQSSFPAMLGAGCLILVGGLLFTQRLNNRGFWFSMVAAVAVLGIAVNGDYDYFGDAQICLQPLAMLGITCAAVALLSVPKALRIAGVLGLAIDAIFGVLLHIHLESYDFQFVPLAGEVSVEGNQELGLSAVNNAFLKYNKQVSFLGDHTVEFSGAIEVLCVSLAAVILLTICLTGWNTPVTGQGWILECHNCLKHVTGPPR